MLPLFSIGVADCLKKSFFPWFTMCVFHELFYTSFRFALKDGMWVWVWERALQSIYHVCLSWTDASFCIYSFPMQGCGFDCKVSFWSVSSKKYTHGFSNKTATRSNYLKITCIMMNVMNEREVNAFLFQWYFLNGAVCPYLDWALMD